MNYIFLPYYTLYWLLRMMHRNMMMSLYKQNVSAIFAFKQTDTFLKTTTVKRANTVLLLINITLKLSGLRSELAWPTTLFEQSRCSFSPPWVLCYTYFRSIIFKTLSCSPMAASCRPPSSDISSGTIDISNFAIIPSAIETSWKESDRSILYFWVYCSD